tara:strand:+ start:3378 stop:4628 length:1251 start_codon:yes stop_codon:yes gene_type:complete
MADPIRGLTQLKDTDFYIYAGSLTALYEYNVTDAVTTNVGAPYTLVEDGVDASQWSMVTYGSFVLATSGKDLPQIQKTRGASFVAVTGMDVTTVEIFMKRGPHVLGFNTSTSATEFVWSDAGDVDTWIAAADNLAGQLDIRELDTPIMAAAPLGDRIAVYGEDQMFVVNYLANDLVYGYQPAINGIGAVSKSAVVAVGRKNYGLSRQGFWATDGTAFDYIDDPMLKHWWREEVNTTLLSKVCSYHDEKNTQVIWYFPYGTTTNSLAVSYNYIRNTWSFITEVLSAVDERRIGEFPIAGTETGGLVLLNNGLNIDGAAIVCTVLTKGIDFENPARVKELDSLRVGKRGVGLTFRTGWAETEEGTITWNAYAAIEEGFNFSNLRTSGRWLYIEFLSNQIDDEWEMFALELKGRVEGTR